MELRATPSTNGGLLQIGNPGNVGGTGRPPSVLRERLRGSYEQRLEILESFVDGDATERADIPLAKILPHVRCPKCGGELAPAEPDAAFLLTITGRVSPKARERIAALDQLARYGLGTTKELSAEDVRGKLARTLETIRAMLPASQAERVVMALRPVWVSAGSAA